MMDITVTDTVDCGSLNYLLLLYACTLRVQTQEPATSPGSEPEQATSRTNTHLGRI